MSKVFISAVTGELRSHRLLVATWLKGAGFEPVVQDTAQQTSLEIAGKLEALIAECEAVVCLIGFAYGAEPSQPYRDYGRRSYTELELLIARRLGKKVYLLRTTPTTKGVGVVTEDDERCELQKKFRDAVVDDRDANSFESELELKALIHGLDFMPQHDGAPRHRPCNLPASIGTLFQGRDEFLQTLAERLETAAGKAAVITPRHAIHGLGGIGKTQLAVEYGWRNKERFIALLYVFANTPTALLTNLAQLTGVLELPEHELSDDNERKKAVVRWLVDHPGWYLLIDNVDTDEGAAAVAKLLDELHGGQIVITTRLASWSNLVEPLELDVLTYEDAAKLLLDLSPQRAKQADDDAQSLGLAEEVDGLALAVTQGAGYINQCRITLAEYAKRLQAATVKVLDWHDPKRMKYPRSLAVTWNTTFDRLSEPARTLLEMLSWLSTEPIPRDLLTNSEVSEVWKAAGVEHSEEALVELADVSLLHVEGNSSRIHRLVQEITRGRCEAGQDTRSLEAMLQVVNAFPLGDATDVRTWHRWEPLIAHVTVVADRGDAHSITTPTARLMNDAALYWKLRIRFPEAERLYRRAIAINERSFGPDHPDVAAGLSNLASLLQETNRLSEAELLVRRALEIIERSMGPEHPNVAIALNNLAQVLQDTNRLPEAEPLMRRALSIGERSFSPDHPNVAIRLSNLALLLKATNRLSEAEPHMRRALSIDERSFGPDHPNVAIRLTNLASLFQATNRRSEAEPLMRRALTIGERSYGPDHPSVAIRLSNLATLLQATDRLKEAEPLMARQFEIFLKFRAATGHEHPYQRVATRNYIGLFQALERTPEQIAEVLRGLSERYGVPIELE